MTQRELAAIMRRPSRLVSELVRGRKGITPETALGLENALGVSAQSWLNLQTSYELVLARQRRTAKTA